MTTPLFKTIHQGRGSSVRFDRTDISLLLDSVPQDAVAGNPELAVVLERLQSARTEASREAEAYEAHLSRETRLGELRLGFFGWKLSSVPDDLIEVYVRTGDFRSDGPGLWSYGPPGAFASESEREVETGRHQACLFSRKRDAWQMVPGLFESNVDAVHAGVFLMDEVRALYRSKRTCPGIVSRDADIPKLSHRNDLAPEPETGEPIGVSKVMPTWRSYAVRALNGVAVLQIMPGSFSTLHNDGWTPARAFWYVRDAEPAEALRQGPFCVMHMDAWAPTVDGSETSRFTYSGECRSRTDAHAPAHVPAFATRGAVVAYVAQFPFVTLTQGEVAEPGPQLPLIVPTRDRPVDLTALFS